MSYAECRVVAAAFNKHKSHSGNIALELGVARSTSLHRVESAKRLYPKLFKTFEPAKGGAMPLADELAAGAFEVFKASGYNMGAAAKTARLHQATFRKRVETHCRRTGIDLATLKYEQSIDSRAAEHHERETERTTAAQLKDAIKRVAELQDRLKDLEWADNVSFKPAEWTFVERVNRKREHMPELFTSDWQVGEVIRESETEAGYGYSPQIFVERYRRMIDTVDYLSHHHGGSGWVYPGIIYLRGGDTLDGAIHPDDQGEQTMTPLQCVELVFEEESAGLEKLADSFGKVEVKTPGSAGNHDRTTKKSVSKKAFAHNYDRLIHKMLVNHFRRDPRVTFQTSESFDIRYKIYDQSVILTHGDHMSGGGGTGFIGPIANILKGWQKVVQEQAALGFIVHQVRSGHYHTPFWTPYGWGNGCMPGYSEFAKSYRMRPSPPMQLFGFHHHKRGLVDMKPLVLTENA
jgi:hypothetical protein